MVSKLTNHAVLNGDKPRTTQNPRYLNWVSFLTHWIQNHMTVCVFPLMKLSAASRTLISQERFLAGISSGAAIAAALKVPLSLAKAKVLTLLPDNGEHFTSLQHLRFQD